MKLVPTKREGRRRRAEQTIDEIKAQAEEWVAETRRGFAEARARLDEELEAARTSVADLERALESERRQRTELERRLEQVAERERRPGRDGGGTPERMDRPSKWAAARKLAAEGYSQREIARRLGINRRTAARLIAADTPPRYRRAPQGSMLDPLEPLMRSVLDDKPGIDAPGMTEVLRGHGYRGSVDLVRRRLRRLRESG